MKERYRIYKFSLLFCFLLSNLVLFAQQYDYQIEFIGRPEFNDTSIASIRFNLLDTDRKKATTGYGRLTDVAVKDTIVNDLRSLIQQPRYIPGSFRNLKDRPAANLTATAGGKETLLNDEITVSVLVDRSGSMTEAKFAKVYEVLRELLNSMPDSSVFISWFNNDISTSFPVTRADFDESILPMPEDPANAHTALNNAIYTKLLEFDSLSVIPNEEHEPVYSKNSLISQRKTPLNYLIVLTDGKDESEKIPKYGDDGFIAIERDRLFATIEEYRSREPKVEIWMIGIKDIDDDRFYDEETMQAIAEKNGNPGNYRRGGEDELPEIFVQVIDDLLPDYQLQIQYPPGTRFSGFKRELRFWVTLPDGKQARGVMEYYKGSKTSPFIINPPNIYEVLLKGAIIGILFLLLIVILIQVIVPLTRSILFRVKYVKKYKPDSDTEKLACAWCKHEIEPGEKAVNRCEHISHWSCWKENNHQCPNYPDQCEKGKQDFFDINDPLAQSDTDSIVKQNKKRFMRWIISGIFAGLITWLVYQVLLHQGVFDRLISMLLPENTTNHENYIEKLSPLLLLGTVLGFFLSLFFLYLEEFRKTTFPIVLRLILRAVIGAVIGFVTFLAGSYILILLRIFQTSFSDVIPWILFGPVMGYYLSIKTTLSASHGIFGGLFSIVFSFITLYLFSFDEHYLIVLSMAIYGGGLGASISTIRHMAEKYFLVLSNAPVKNKEFPLHKWISKSADYGIFTIGKGNKCIIRMDWEKDEQVNSDIHAVIYLERSQKDYAVITIRDTGNKNYLNDHILLRPEKEYTLHNGDTFKIGETRFKYEEKQ